MTGHVPPFPRPESWAKSGAKYRIATRYSGVFIASCVENHGSWATFQVIDHETGQDSIKFDAGDTVDMPRDAVRCEELE